MGHEPHLQPVQRFLNVQPVPRSVRPQTWTIPRKVFTDPIAPRPFFSSRAGTASVTILRGDQAPVHQTISVGYGAAPIIPQPGSGQPAVALDRQPLDGQPPNGQSPNGQQPAGAPNGGQPAGGPGNGGGGGGSGGGNPNPAPAPFQYPPLPPINIMLNQPPPSQKLDVKKTESFSGTRRDELNNFLIACRNNFAAQRNHFQTEASKILYAASFFTG